MYYEKTEEEKDLWKKVEPYIYPKGGLVEDAPEDAKKALEELKEIRDFYGQ